MFLIKVKEYYNLGDWLCNSRRDEIVHSLHYESATSSVRFALTQRAIDANWFRDSTQIVLPAGALSDDCDELEQRFMITIVDERDTTRLVGSPVVIPKVRDWLVSQGIVAPTFE